jgi:glutamate racemase
MRAEFADLSFSGVIEPTARAAVEAAGAMPRPLFAVIATEATIRSRAYERALARRRNRSMVLLRPAPLLVPIIEEGRDSSDPLARMALRQYLQPLQSRKIDVLVLGCTHYPILKKAIEQIVGPNVAVVDASQKCAEDVARRLRSAGKLSHGVGGIRCNVTDDPVRFRQFAKKLLGMNLDEPNLVRIDDLPSARAQFIRAA